MHRPACAALADGLPIPPHPTPPHHTTSAGIKRHGATVARRRTAGQMRGTWPGCAARRRPSGWRRQQRAAPRLTRPARAARRLRRWPLRAAWRPREAREREPALPREALASHTLSLWAGEGNGGHGRLATLWHVRHWGAALSRPCQLSHVITRAALPLGPWPCNAADRIQTPRSARPSEVCVPG